MVNLTWFYLASGQAGRQYPGPLVSTLCVGMIGQNQSYEKHEENEAALSYQKITFLNEGFSAREYQENVYKIILKENDLE